jgi:hypothetical protein
MSLVAVCMYTPCRRYRLSDHTPCTAAAAQQLAAIDQSTDDIEERADLMGATLLAPVMGELASKRGNVKEQ